jgi:transcriptional regulator with XRE-family HTH domain
MGRLSAIRREVVNSPEFPASDDTLVEALIGFLNGAEVVMLDKPRERPAPIQGKPAYPRAPVELRLRFADLVEDVRNGREKFRPAGEGKIWAKDVLSEDMAGSDLGPRIKELREARGLDQEGLAHLLISMGASATITRGTIAKWESGETRDIGNVTSYYLAKWVRSWIEGDKALLRGLERMGRVSFMEFANNLLARTPVKEVLVFDSHGFSFQYFRDFEDFEAMLTHAVVLLLDERKTYGAALCRCKLPTCDRFYLACKNPKGGPANRNYCSPGHRAVAHDSRKHRAEMKAARRHK